VESTKTPLGLGVGDSGYLYDDLIDGSVVTVVNVIPLTKQVAVDVEVCGYMQRHRLAGWYQVWPEKVDRIARVERFATQGTSSRESVLKSLANTDDSMHIYRIQLAKEFTGILPYYLREIAEDLLAETESKPMGSQADNADLGAEKTLAEQVKDAEILLTGVIGKLDVSKASQKAALFSLNRAVVPIMDAIRALQNE
jgi:hypothetical protein